MPQRFWYTLQPGKATRASALQAFSMKTWYWQVHITCSYAHMLWENQKKRTKEVKTNSSSAWYYMAPNPQIVVSFPRFQRHQNIMDSCQHSKNHPPFTLSCCIGSWKPCSNKECVKQQDSIAIRSGDDKVECANQRPQKVPMVLRAQNFRTARRKNYIIISIYFNFFVDWYWKTNQILLVRQIWSDVFLPLLGTQARW